MASNINCLLLILLLLHVSVSLGSFSWNDCGVPAYRNIHYQSASISPSVATQGGSLSINVQATVVSVLADARTRVIVVKEGVTFLDVYIQNLCSIITTTESLSCPLQPGPVSFTYTFTNIPELPSGSYDIYIHSVPLQGQGSTEFGCIQLSGEVSGLAGTSCHYTSSFSVPLEGYIQYGQQDPASRQKGSSITVGPIGTSNQGNFSGSLTSTADLGGTRDLTNYAWGLAGVLTDIQQGNTSTQLLQTFAGNFTVAHFADGAYSTLLSGQFNWLLNVDSTRVPAEIITGSFILSPQFVYSPLFQYPITLGNLEPFQMTTRADRTFIVSASSSYCTCAVDRCGVCGGDSLSCGRVAPNPTEHKLTKREIAAIVIGTVGGFFGILAIVILTRRIIRAKNARPHDDSDLIDHPQKPDYGTMAIDESIREGERILV